MVHTSARCLIMTEYELLPTAAQVGSISVVTELITATIIYLTFIDIYGSDDIAAKMTYTHALFYLKCSLFH